LRKPQIWPLSVSHTLIDTLQGDVTSRPSLHMHADQCTIGGVTIHFLTPRLRCTGNPDPFHRLWNDAQDGYKLAGQWGNVGLLTAAISCHIGPFKSSDFLRQLQDACMEIRSFVGADHPIMATLPFVLRDLNISETEDHTPEKLWELAMNSKFGSKQCAAMVTLD